MFSLTWRKQQLATDFLLACPRSKQPKGLLHVFPSQSCLQSFVLPSGTFLPSISSDVWRYFGISTLFLEVFQSTSPNDCFEGQHQPRPLHFSPCAGLPGSFPYRARQQGTHGFETWLCQNISVRLIFNKTVFPILVITRQPKWCHTTLKTAEQDNSKEILNIKSVLSRWGNRDEEGMKNKASKIAHLSYFSIHASCLSWNQFYLHLN